MNRIPKVEALVEESNFYFEFERVHTLKKEWERTQLTNKIRHQKTDHSLSIVFEFDTSYLLTERYNKRLLLFKWERERKEKGEGISDVNVSNEIWDMRLNRNWLPFFKFLASITVHFIHQIREDREKGKGAFSVSFPIFTTQLFERYTLPFTKRGRWILVVGISLIAFIFSSFDAMFDSLFKRGKGKNDR
jgi:hypothetical protein